MAGFAFTAAPTAQAQDSWSNLNREAQAIECFVWFCINWRHMQKPDQMVMFERMYAQDLLRFLPGHFLATFAVQAREPDIVIGGS